MGDTEKKKGMLDGESPVEAIKRLHGEMAVYTGDIQGALALYGSRKKELEGYETELKARDEDLQKKEQKLTASQEALSKSNIDYENNMREYNEQVDVLNAEIDKLHAEQKALADEKAELAKERANVRETLQLAAEERKQHMMSEDKKRELKELESKIVGERSTYESLLKDVAKIDDAVKEVEKRKADIQAKENQVQTRQQELQAKEDRVQYREQKLMDRELELKGKENAYEMKINEQSKATAASAKDERAQLGAALVPKADMEKPEPAVVDDSVVRGTTTKKAIGQLHEQAKAALQAPKPAEPAKAEKPAEDVPSYLNTFESMDDKELPRLSPVLKNYAQNRDYKVNPTGMGRVEIVSYNPKLTKDIEDFYAPKPEPAPKPAEQPKAEEKPPKQRKMKNNPLDKGK